MTDHARITELLGRSPRGRYEVVVRDPNGDPVVLRNAPFLDDGTPMPTLYWLCSPTEIRRIGQIESAGGVDLAEAEVDADELAAAHERYGAERDRLIPADHDGPRPTGGVGGTRVGVKCLHAHWAWHLAGGDDPIGRWIENELTGGVTITIGESSTTVTWGSTTATLPWGSHRLADHYLAHDPARPEDLTIAIGAVADPLAEIITDHPDLVTARPLRIAGADQLVWLEAGHRNLAGEIVVARDDVEEVFRMIAMEPVDQCRHHPGLTKPDTIVGLTCVVVAILRQLQADRARFIVEA